LMIVSTLPTHGNELKLISIYDSGISGKNRSHIADVSLSVGYAASRTE